MPFWLFACLSIVSLSLHAEELDHWLEKMQQATMHSNYEGILIIRQDDHMQTLRVRHGMDDRGMWETLDSLNGEARKITRANGRVITVFPERKLLTISRYSLSSPMHPQLPNDREKFRQYYRLKLAGQERIADKLARILDVTPVDQYRYGYRFWLAENSGLLLKCDLKEPDGNIIEQLMYSSLTQLDQPPPQSRFDDDKDFHVINMDEKRVDLPSSPVKIARLPAGFELMQASRQPAIHGKGDVYHLVYSDGMASVSIFMQQKAANKAALEGQSRMGAVNVMVRPLGEYQLTVMGEVPMATIEMMAQSASLKAND